MLNLFQHLLLKTQNSKSQTFYIQKTIEKFSSCGNLSPIIYILNFFLFRRNIHTK